MDARQLRYFLAIVDEGGYRRAAERLLIAQPSLSQAIAGLERELGIPLFHRVGRRVVLSEAGEDLVEPARRVVRDLESAEATVLRHRGLHAGRLDIATMPSPGIEPFASLARAFLAEHEDVRINATAAFVPEEVVASVLAGEVELGLIGSREPLRQHGIRVHPLGRQRLVLVVNPALWDPGELTEIDRSDLDGQPLVVSQRGSLMRWLVDDMLASGAGPRIVAEVAHRTSVLPLVLAGVGHAVVPAAWRGLAEAAGLRVVRIAPASHLHVALVHRPEGLTPPAEAFVRLALDRRSRSSA